MDVPSAVGVSKSAAQAWSPCHLESSTSLSSSLRPQQAKDNGRLYTDVCVYYRHLGSPFRDNDVFALLLLSSRTAGDDMTGCRYAGVLPSPNDI